MTKVMFFKMGQWEWVIIDDLIPMSPDEEEAFICQLQGG